MTDLDEFHKANVHRLEADAERPKAQISHVEDCRIQDRQDHDAHLAFADRKARSAERKLKAADTAHAEELDKKEEEIQRLKTAHIAELRKIRKSVATTETKNSELAASQAEAKAEVSVHHHMTAENNQALRLEMTSLHQTMENNEARVGNHSGRGMQLRARHAAGQDMAAARQQVTDNVQVFINHQTHLKSEHKRSGLIKKLTKMVKSMTTKNKTPDKDGGSLE